MSLSAFLAAPTRATHSGCSFASNARPAWGPAPEPASPASPVSPASEAQVPDMQESRERGDVHTVAAGHADDGWVTVPARRGKRQRATSAGYGDHSGAEDDDQSDQRQLQDAAAVQEHEHEAGTQPSWCSAGPGSRWGARHSGAVFRCQSWVPSSRPCTGFTVQGPQAKSPTKARSKRAARKSKLTALGMHSSSSGEHGDASAGGGGGGGGVREEAAVGVSGRLEKASKKAVMQTLSDNGWVLRRAQKHQIYRRRVNGVVQQVTMAASPSDVRVWNNILSLLRRQDRAAAELLLPLDPLETLSFQQQQQPQVACC